MALHVPGRLGETVPMITNEKKKLKKLVVVLQKWVGSNSPVFGTPAYSELTKLRKLF